MKKKTCLTKIFDRITQKHAYCGLVAVRKKMRKQKRFDPFL